MTIAGFVVMQAFLRNLRHTHVVSPILKGQKLFVGSGKTLKYVVQSFASRNDLFMLFTRHKREPGESDYQ